MLASAWTYFLVLSWRKDPLEAAVACILVGLSWEVGYHARWIAPDGLVLSLGALTMLCALRGTWLTGAAAAAGLACSAKYPAGLFLVPVLLAADTARRRTGALAVFAAAYLATTPGTVLDAPRFLADIREELAIYASGHFGYTVSGPLEHLRLALDYLGLVAFSRYAEVSAAFAGLALYGAATALREERRKSIVYLSFPVLYLAYFSFQKVLIARNLLVLIPFMAVMAARGWGEALRRLPRPVYRRAFIGTTALFFLLNLAWLASAAASIRRPGEDLAGLAAYLDSHPKTRFALSPKAAAALSRPRTPLADAEQAVLYASEVASERWLANRRGYAAAWFGPYEVNFDYYPTWQGRDRLIVMPAARAVELGLF